MGMKIITQPDGKYGLFSTYSDTIIAIDCDEEEMIRIWRDRAAAEAEREMKSWLAQARGEEPRIWAEPLTLKQALKDHLFHGEKDKAEWDQMIKERKVKEGVK